MRGKVKYSQNREGGQKEGGQEKVGGRGGNGKRKQKENTAREGRRWKVEIRRRTRAGRKGR